MKYKLSDAILINPKEVLVKGTIAKKISMEKLQPFFRDVPTYEQELFSGGSKFRNGDTIMARITPCLENGKTAKVNMLNDNEVGFGSTEFIVFRALADVTDEDYVYYLLCSPLIRDMAIKSMVGSSGRQRVQTDVLANLVLDIPDLQIQRKIGMLLKSIDDKIANNNAINNNLQQQVQAIFKAWFVDFEPFGGVQPNNLRYVTLENLCATVTKGTTPTTLGKPFVEYGINFVKAESLLDTHSFDQSKFSYIDDETHRLLKRSIIADKDILFTIAGTLGRFAMVDDEILPANTNQAVAIIRANESISPYYLYSFFLGNWHIDYYANRIQQAVQANLSLSTIKSLPIAIIENTQMRDYLAIIEPLIKQKMHNDRENRRLITIRDTLLPKLMSGEIDVSKVEI